MTRQGGSIASHARLTPVTGTAVVGGGIALGPLIGLLVLSVGAEMIARSQQDQKLEAIHKAITRVERHDAQQLVASLDAAERAMESATAALLDQVRIPEAVGFGAACAELMRVKQLGLRWLDGWESRARKISIGDEDQINIRQMVDIMGEQDLGGFGGFALRVELLYRSLALDSRRIVLARADTSGSGSDHNLDNFHRDVARGLSANTEALGRLRSFINQIAGYPVTTGFWSKDSTESAVVQTRRLLPRLAIALAEAPPSPPVLTVTNRLAVDAYASPNGTWSVEPPRAEAVSDSRVG